MDRKSPTDRQDMLTAMRKNLRASIRKFVQADAGLAKRHGLHATDLASLELLETSDAPVTAGALADHLGLSTGAVTAAISRLEKAGFVERAPDDLDKRRVLISLRMTPDTNITSLTASLGVRYASLTAGFSDSELEVISRFLAEMSSVMISGRDLTND